jgi:ATP-binding cassette subfamily B protein
VLNAVYLPIILTLGSVAIALALAVGGRQVVVGSLTVGETVMFIYYAQLFFGPVQDMSMWFAEMQMAQASAERVLSLIEATPEVRDDERVIRHLRRNPTPEAIGRIEFEHVSFQYRNGPTVIEDLSLVVEPGETIALVGATGGGKTTLVNLLCRFYEPSSGRILLGGVDYRDRGLEWLYSKLGVVLQHPHLFSGTIAENIRYGRLNATAEEVREAAQLACADEFVSALERGYDTEVGEGGNQLSHGQKQLISFARAILRQPQLLVMDEATSSVDTNTEQQIQQGLASVLKGRTGFVIAHRLSTIRGADRILVIDKGRIVEEGRHRELLRRGGRYYELYAEQSLRDAVQLALP